MQPHDPLKGSESNAAFAHYEARIRTLTHLLDKYPCRIPISNLDPEDLEENEELRFYYYLATLLTTGSLDQNCAVTAVLLPGLVRCIIVHTGRARQDNVHAQAPHTPAQVHRVQERAIDIQTLGSLPSDSATIDFETHAADLLHALRTFHDTLHDESQPSPYWHFLRFIVRRCHSKIAERMQNGERIWKRHPMAVLSDWHPNGAHFEREEFSIHHQILEATISLYGLTPASEQGDRKTFYVDSDNVGQWAQITCALYGMLEKRLFTPYFEGTEIKVMPRGTMDVDSIHVVADYLDTFSVLLDLPPIQAILTHKSYTEMLEPARTVDASAAAHEQPVPNPKPTPKHAGPDGGVPSDEARRREVETEGEHVYRYLRAIVSWVSAILAVAQHDVFRNHVPVEVYHVHLPSETTSEFSALNSVRQDILGRYSEDTPAARRAQAFFDVQQRRRRPLTDSIHAESALLGILVDETKEALPDVRRIFEHNGHTFKDVGSIFPQGYLSIGSTHNCCFCCWSLAEYVSKKTGLQVILSGTHGIVRPWVAARGVPVEELRTLDATLLDALRERLEKSEESADDDDNVETKHRFHWLCSVIC
ncbi:hypothetical protein PsYK624_131680 [Phanerochaete sordida]|uniref:Uncharacterized protein n=1 Tax=Phanerochaete sordida TaxID=48140 RepID=A0A9P3LJ67_9APHY|nr:hypothetical protein PsYK624_131680 [Phanerochaete sordida]